MQQNLRRIVCCFLVLAMLLNMTALSAPKAHAAVSPTRVNDALSKFADASVKITQGFSEGTSGITKFFTRFGGVTSYASCVIGILQMAGIIKDPTTEMLKQILDILHDMQATLARMDQKLDDIMQTLLAIQVDQKIIDRTTNARDMSKNWNDFNTDYVEPLNDLLNVYQTKVTDAVRAWWNQQHTQGVRVLVMTYSADEVSQTYSRAEYSAGVPDSADNGDVVNKAWSIGVPAEYIPDTSAVKFNVDTYRDDFNRLMIEKLRAAIADNNIDGGPAFVAGAANNTKLLEQYADYVLNVVIYEAACEAMTNDNVWVTSVINAYRNYCNNIMKQNSGINAFMNYIYLTHGFEGEVKEDIESFYDNMVFQAGYYGEFALTCAGQDSLISQTVREEIQGLFADTVISLSDRKSKALTGHDNYCYITGTILEAYTASADSYMDVYVDDDGYDKYSKGSWSASIPSIVDSVYIQVLYRQWQAVPNGAGSFADYLNGFGVGNEEYYVTRYIGAEDFNLDDGIEMRADSFISGGAYFVTGNTYYINIRSKNEGRGGKPQKAKDDHFHVHDKILCDFFDCETGELEQRHMLGARAFYGNGSWKWNYDEAYTFRTDNIVYGHTGGGKQSLGGDDYRYRPTFDLYFRVLRSTPCHSLNGDNFYDDEENPFAAYDLVSLTLGISDSFAPHYENESKDITEVEIEGDSFVYAGVPVEPKVLVVRASGDVVPEDGYIVSYVNNDPSKYDEDDDDDDSQYSWVVVTGVGDYSGSVSVRFTITSGAQHHHSSGCNAMGNIGLLLGLVFMVKKHRRR